jgi:O-antigen/teichoic acid export membrane protein
MALLDLGLRGAVTRYVSRGAAQENHDEANEAVSAALWIRMWISLIIILLAVLFALLFTKAFSIPSTLQHAARLAILVTAASLAFSLWCGVFAGVLMALHRYDILSSIAVFQTICRAVGYVYLLRTGHGILALALLELLVAGMASCAQILFAFQQYPQLHIVFHHPSPQVIRKLWNYSLYAFLINVAIQVAYYTDNLVVGAFAGAAAVTFYAIGGTLITYARQIVTSMTTTFGPLASTFEARGEDDSMRRLLIQGTRAALIVSLPIELALFTRGQTFIRLWMGEQYARPSGLVMEILMLSLILSSANTTSAGIVYGMEKHKKIAHWAIVEAIANLVLSIVLVRRIGIYGVALGTTIPSVIIEILLWPKYISRLTGIRVRDYLWQTWIRTTIAMIPFGIACYVADQHWPASNLITFFSQIAALLPLIPLALFLIFYREVSQQAKENLLRFVPWGVPSR